MTAHDREQLAQLSRRVAEEEDLGKFHDLVRSLNQLLERNLQSLREANLPYKRGQ